MSVCPEQRALQLVKGFCYARCHGCRAQLGEITFAGGEEEAEGCCGARTQ